jgi:hypothetical protein
MNFVLRYRGPLPSNGDAKDKHRIRVAIHPQLETLCTHEPLFKQALDGTLPEGRMKGSEVDVPRPLEALFWFARLNGFQVVPLIHRPHELACRLEIMFLRRERPGAILRGGDLDNRLKTLFDALRMPQTAAEVGASASEADERLYCLLQDDSLITHLSVSTYQLLEPLATGENQDTVELLIQVSVQATYPMVGNLGFSPS